MIPSLALTPRQAKEIASRAFPGNVVKALRPQAEGPEEVRYLLHLVRSPFKAIVSLHRGQAAERLRHEMSALTALEAGGAQIPVPRIRIVDPAGGPEGATLSVRTHPDGLEWSGAYPLLSPVGQAEAARGLVEALRALHAIRARGFGEVDAPTSWTPTWEASLEQTLDRALEALRSRGWLGLGGAMGVRRIWEERSEVLRVGPPAALVHGALSARRVLLKREGDRWALVGLLDLGRARYWHPLWDWARIQDRLPTAWPLISPLLREVEGPGDLSSEKREAARELLRLLGAVLDAAEGEMEEGKEGRRAMEEIIRGCGAPRGRDGAGA